MLEGELGELIAALREEERRLRLKSKASS
jgi:hypothetical protein